MHGRNFFNSIANMCIKYGLFAFVICLNCNGVQANSLWPPKLLGKLKPEEKAMPLPPPTKGLAANDVNPCIRNGCKIFGPLCEHGKCTESVSLKSCQWMCRCEPGWRGYLCEEKEQSLSKGAQPSKWNPKPKPAMLKVSISKPLSTSKAPTTTTTITTTVAPTTVTVTNTVTPTTTITTTGTLQPATSTSTHLETTPSTTVNAKIAQTVTTDMNVVPVSTTTKTITTNARATTTGVPTTVSSTTIKADTSATTDITGSATKVSSTSTESHTTTSSTTPTTGAAISHITSTMQPNVVPVTSTVIKSQHKGPTTPKESVTSGPPVPSTMSIKRNFPRVAAQIQREVNVEKTAITTTVSEQLGKTTFVTVATDIPVIVTTSKPPTKTTNIIESTTKVQDTIHVSNSGKATKQVPVVNAGQIGPDSKLPQPPSTLKPTPDGATTNIPSTTLPDISTSTPLKITTTTKPYSSKATSQIAPSTTTQTPSSTVTPTPTRDGQSTTSGSSTTRPLVQSSKLELSNQAPVPSREEVVLFPKLSGRKRKPFISATFHRKPKPSSQEETVLFPEASPEQKTVTISKPVAETKNTMHRSILKDIKKMHTFFTNLGGTARNVLPDNKSV